MSITTALRLAFVDTETTGLDSRIHQAYEFSWCVEEPTVDERRIVTRPQKWSRVRTIHPGHDLAHATPEALAIGQYFARGFAPRSFPSGPTSTWVDAILDLTGATLVAANPAFDQEMLTNVFGFRPWHYRVINVEDLAYQELGLAKPEGLASVTSKLLDLGYKIPDQDHTSDGDVRTLRECYYALMDLRAKRFAA